LKNSTVCRQHDPEDIVIMFLQTVSDLTHEDSVTSKNTLIGLLLKEPKNLTGITVTTFSLCHCPVVSLLVLRLQSDFAFKVVSAHFKCRWTF
jgi:hypothetical protein